MDVSLILSTLLRKQCPVLFTLVPLVSFIAAIGEMFINVLYQTCSIEN
jgi:hypothetical protein